MNFWTAFTFPGRVIAWFGYMFPKRGEVWASARRVDNPAIHFLFSLIFYAVIGYFGFAVITADRSPVEARAPVAPDAHEVAADVPLDAAPAPASTAPLLSANTLGPVEAPVTPDGAIAMETAERAVYEPVLNEGVASGTSPSGGARPTVDVHSVRPTNTPALLDAVLRLLDSGPAERHGTWRTDEVGGDLMVAPWRRTSGGVCRLYSFTARSETEVAASGYQEACRIGDGPWTFQ